MTTLQLVPPPSREAVALRREIEALPRTTRLVASGPFRVHVAPSIAIPRTLRELGRLRAAAFPGAFGPEELDLDAHDVRYLHLFLWDDEAGEIAGAYRLGATDLLGAIAHPERLYTHELFDFDARLLRRLDPALELGRSFVSPAYRRSTSALHLLWRGIGAFIARHPRYRTLFGALTIPHDLTPEARDFCLAFLQALEVPEPMAGLARGRVPVEGWAGRRAFVAAATTLDELERQLESAGGAGVPPLLRHYARLGARAFDFSVDPSFGGSVDALIVVDLAAAPAALRERYLGPPRAKSEGCDPLLRRPRPA